MKFLFDLFPVILFFVAFKFAGIFVATAVAIGATVVQIAWVLARGRKVTNMQWASLAIIGIFGGATLLLHDETFIKWKPTVLYWLAGSAFLVALAFGKNLVKAVMSEGLQLPEAVWFKLAVAWGVFFLFKGTLNLYVAYTFPTEIWVNFKLFGGMGLMIAFVLAQALWLAKYLPDEAQKPASSGAAAKNPEG
ncbi:MAG TPA: septation protein A [Usitatibacter sp.]|nr:septation protein A [Usitatibacter sp.]